MSSDWSGNFLAINSGTNLSKSNLDFKFIKNSICSVNKLLSLLLKKFWKYSFFFSSFRLSSEDDLITSWKLENLAVLNEEVRLYIILENSFGVVKILTNVSLGTLLKSKLR